MNKNPASAVLPTPGVLWGLYPERRTADRGERAAPASPARYRDIAARARSAAARWSAMQVDEESAALERLRAGLRREGLDGIHAVDALGCVTHFAARTLGVALFDTQLFAAAVLLDGHLAEMATGEGKTYAAALAAATAALAGVPVHVITANDYLAARDAKALAPLYRALGLEVGTIDPALPGDTRRAIYARDIVYCTARELVFDYLRDRQTLGTARAELARRAIALTRPGRAEPLLRGLCMAIIDEADSVLLDEATMPLILSESIDDPQHRAFLWQALALARELEPGLHFEIDTEARAAELTVAGTQRLAVLSKALAGSWQSARRGTEAVCTALAALHAFHADHDYLVREGRVEIIDRVTGRTAPGRVWSRGLHGLIELKEGCRVSADTRTIAQITYQRFFPRYVKLCGMSGTLAEARAELKSTYGLAVVPVPLLKASARARLPAMLFADSASRWDAVVERIAALNAARRPVLVGTDSVADSEALSVRLAERGIAHTVLNARQDEKEAAIVANAGRIGAVTVSTNMAGRGTDIALEPHVAALGGLHIICCQHNASRRIDRQLEGRCARQGDPGSVETWLAADAGLFASTRGLTALIALVARMPRSDFLLRALSRIPQHLHERRDTAQRRQLVQHDLEWQRRATFAPPAE